MPFAFFCGFGLIESKPYGMLAVLYYVLLLASLWGCRRFGGWVGRWYSLAFGITWIHLMSVGVVLVSKVQEIPSKTSEFFFGLVLLSILGVYLAACCAGCALALRQNRTLEGGVQLGLPFLLLGSGVLGMPALIIAYGGQAMHALWLSIRLVDQVNYEEIRTLGFTPGED